MKEWLSRTPICITENHIRVVILLFFWYFNTWLVICLYHHLLLMYLGIVKVIVGRLWPCFSLRQTALAFLPRHSSNLMRISIGLRNELLVICCDIEQLILYALAFSLVKRLREVLIKYHMEECMCSVFGHKNRVLSVCPRYSIESLH